MSITYMHWQNSFYHKNVGGRAAAINFFISWGENFFLCSFGRDSHFFERFELQNIDEAWWHPLQYSSMIKKYDIYHRHNCFIFLCWKIMWKYFLFQENIKILGISIVFIQMDSGRGKRGNPSNLYKILETFCDYYWWEACFGLNEVEWKVTLSLALVV